MKTVDVAVIGTGSVGSMALWRLSQVPGLSVLGIEQFGAPHAHGAYAGESRLFRVAAKEGALYTPLALRARELWTELENESKRRVLVRTGALSIAPEGHPLLDFTLSSIDEYRLPHRLMNARELRREYPQFYIEDGDIGVIDTLGGALRPEYAVDTAIRAAAVLGAETWFNASVLDIVPDDEGVTVITANGEVRAAHVIVTGGAWTTRLLPELRELIDVVAYALTWFVPEDISQFTPDRFPGFMRDLACELGEIHAFGVPTLEGYSLKVAPSLDIAPFATPEDRPRDLDRDTLVRLGQEAQALIPQLNPEPVRWSTHPESITSDHVPVLDTLSSGRITVGSGFSGNGFKFAPVYGQLLAELATSGASELQHPLFTIASHRERAAAHAQGLAAVGDDLIMVGH